jgi:NAD(P)-dependent dehydrogenase (short-subunit alcohol dehydrogenase family)
MTLQGMMALITGGTGGLGQAVTRAVVRAGAAAVVTHIVPHEADALQQAMQAHNFRCELVQVDVTDPPAVQQLVRDVLARHGRIELLVNLVGGYLGGIDVADLSDEDWNHQLNLNLRSAFVCCRAVVPHMVAQGAGRIVSVASRAAVRPGPGSAAYNVSKAGVISLTETLSEEVKRHGVNVNCILPSVIDTPANRRAMPDANFDLWVKPEDIAEVIVFLLSDASRAITGAAIPIYGRA